MQQWRWQKSGEANVLINNNEVLIRLLVQNSLPATIEYNNDTYLVTKSGHFTPKYTLLKNNQVEMALTHKFWGSNGRIEFNDGKKYEIQYKLNAAKNICFTENGLEFMHYVKQQTGSEPQLLLQVNHTILDADHLLLMAALGKFLYIKMYSNTSDDDLMTSLLLTSI